MAEAAFLSFALVMAAVPDQQTHRLVPIHATTGKYVTRLSVARPFKTQQVGLYADVTVSACACLL